MFTKTESIYSGNSVHFINICSRKRIRHNYFNSSGTKQYELYMLEANNKIRQVFKG